MVKNVYIHIPFCVKKCNYCAFTSYSKLQQKPEYIKALLKEIKANYQGEKLNTLYFGGGTPSLLNIDELKQIIDCFNLALDCEVTFEVNPNRLKINYLKELKEAGVNRLSIGAQVFDDSILKIIGRLHTTDDIKYSVENARNAGFDNISIDLIYGLPMQTFENFEYSLRELIKLDVEHVSLYGLKIEENTAFFYNLPNSLPDDDAQADMYLLAGNVLRKAGYEKYEISNFSKAGFYSRHNLNYWNANTYYGFGCGAHGYIQNIRYENQIDLTRYIQNPLKVMVETELNLKNQLEESIFLGFRKTEGIDVSYIKECYNYDFEKENELILKEFLKSSHVVKTQTGYAFTDEGFLLSNEILCNFLVNIN